MKLNIFSLFVINLIFILIIPNSTTAAGFPDGAKGYMYDSLQFGGITRTFFLHVPENYNSALKHSLIIALHGEGSNSYNMMSGSRLSEHAEKDSLIIIYPEGIGKNFGLTARSWNAGDCCGFAHDNNIDDIGFISALIDSTKKYYNIDSARVYAVGFSTGGMMCYRLACTIYNKIAAIGTVAAAEVISPCPVLRPVPLIHFHSALDNYIPPDGGKGSAGQFDINFLPLNTLMEQWSNINGCRTQISDYHTGEYYRTKRFNCNCEAEIYLYMTSDGGHSWPGGNNMHPYDISSQYLSATDSIIAFLKTHKLTCVPSDVLHPGIIQPLYMNINPNPASDYILIDLQSDYRFTFNSEIIIYNIIGEICYKNRWEVSEKNVKIFLDGFNSGIYYISCNISGMIYRDILVINR